MSDTDRNRWPSLLSTCGEAYSAMTLGIMIDESVGGEINLVCPAGRVAVTSELSVDFAWPAAADIGSLRCEGELVALAPDRALAQGVVRTDAGVIVANATTWCIFIDGGGQEVPGFFSIYAPPPDLELSEMLKIDGAGTESFRAQLRPDRRAANDLGNLHGGVLLAAMHDVGRSWLAASMIDPIVTSVRVNYLRPGLLDGPLEIEVSPLHAGRTVAVAQLRSRNSLGKITAVATVTACASTA